MSSRPSHLASLTPKALAFATVALRGCACDEDAAVEAAMRIREIDNVLYAQSFRPEAIAAIPGIELTSSAELAVNRFNDFRELHHLLIAGYHGEKRVSEMFAQDVVCDYFGVNPERRANVYSQGIAKHAGEQAQWIAMMMATHKISSVEVVAPAFHLPRFYLTLLEALRRKFNSGGDFAEVIVVPTAFKQSPTARTLLDIGAEALEGESDDREAYRTLCEADVVAGEYDRVRKYQLPKSDGSPGDCLTTERLRKYCAWVERMFK